jgi:predicted ATP-grasp superfamily ATP-dependent carboligase
MTKILVPDYLGKQVRAGIRSLRKQGDTIDLAWNNQRFRKSIYIQSYFTITSSEVNDAKYIEDVISLYRRNSYEMILPFGNTSYYAVARHAERLKSNNVKFMAPDYDTFTMAHDKFKTIQFCKAIGIKTPELFTQYEENDIKGIANHVQYPVVIKAKSGSGIFSGLRYANNRRELLQYYDEVRSFHSRTGASNFDSPMIQEFIPGFIHDACTLTNHGRVVAILTQRRHLMYPIYGGVGAVNVTTHDKKLSDIARQLLEEIKWHGPAQVEFKFDERDKEYKLIELNPKLWGTLDLSLKVDFNFPAMIRDILLEKNFVPPDHYPEGIRYKFLFPQAITAYCQMIKDFGLKSVFDARKYQKTYYDIEAKDWFFDLGTAISTFKGLCFGKITPPNANLSRQLINRSF